MVLGWHQRMFPYPLLASWTRDYQDSDFGVSTPNAMLRNGTKIEVDLQFRLTSEYLGGLIERGNAQYVIEISCPKTFTRHTQCIGREEKVVLEAGDYAEEMFITPLIASTKSLEGFLSREHASEWREYRPKGFDIPEAGILAIGNVVRVTIEETGVNSVIDLTANQHLDEGIFHIELEEERIKIHVSPQDKERIEALRQRRNSGDTGFSGLFPSLYLSAVSEALRQLRDYQNTRWAFAIRIALERCGLGEVSPEIIEEQSLVYAQRILDHPMSGFLDAAVNREEDE